MPGQTKIRLYKTPAFCFICHWRFASFDRIQCVIFYCEFQKIHVGLLQ